MTKNSESAELVPVLSGVSRPKLSPTQLRLRITAAVLALLNLVAVYFYVAPPGGTRQDLEIEKSQVAAQIKATQIQASKSRSLANNVQTASEQAVSFSNKYFLPKRTATVAVLEEIQRMARESGITEKEASWSPEPIEGTADLTLFNITAAYEGTNANLMKFLYAADHSPMLLMLDSMQASPQQHNNQISTAIKFQAIVRESDTGVPTTDSPSGSAAEPVAASTVSPAPAPAVASTPAVATTPAVAQPTTAAAFRPARPTTTTVAVPNIKPSTPPAQVGGAQQ